ncbi:MAG: response regulator receiver protein [Labilithrix sp.]|jgi:CheY-like chemotaxis protein|nr:response regulator receiver protein [Labilithrix sp.]
MAAPPVVLIVEDNAELRVALKEALTSQGYEVLAARDEAEALEQLRSRPVNLFISDLSDPPQTSSSIRAVREEFPDLPVVALSEGAGTHPALFFTAWRDPKEVRRLPKPFRLGELLAVSREVLGAP